jgi:hypothetical protein
MRIQKVNCFSRNLICLLNCTQCDAFYVGGTKNSLSTKINVHWFSINKPKNLPLPVITHIRPHQLPFNMCWNVIVLHNLPPNPNQITAAILKLLINSFYLPDIALVSTADESIPLFPLPSLLSVPSLGVFLSCKTNARRSVHSPQDHFIITLIISDRCDWPTLGASGLWIGTRTGAGATARLTKVFFGRSPWLHGQQVLPLVAITQNCHGAPSLLCVLIEKELCEHQNSSIHFPYGHLYIFYPETSSSFC